MDVSIQEFRFNKVLRENKNAPKERLYKELLLEVKKMMVALQKGRRDYLSIINCLRKVSVDDANEVVERLYTMNSELRNYIRVEFETKTSFELSNFRTEIPRDSKIVYAGLPITKLCVVIEVK